MKALPREKRSLDLRLWLIVRVRTTVWDGVGLHGEGLTLSLSFLLPLLPL